MNSNSAVERSTFSTTSCDEAYGFLKQAYADHRLTYSPAPEDFRFTASTAIAGTVSGAHIRASMHYGGHAESNDKVVMCVIAAGRLDYRNGQQECACEAGEAFAMTYDDRTEAATHDPDVVTLQVPTERVTQVAQANFGALHEPFKLHSIKPISPAMNRFFIDTVSTVTSQLLSTEGRAFEYPLVARQLVDLAITAMLNGFPNPTMTADYRQPSRTAGQAAVRRAVAYIDEHADEPISVADVAGATGVGAKELQAAFARDHQTTPLEYLRRVRLDGAHRDLVARTPDGGDTVATVAAIAYRWGFANSRLFAALYRATYGRAPGVTLGEDPQ
jgi:AraC-like DNA-binding protein